MNEQNEELTIRRILVALDASHHSLAALEAAAELAAGMEAELQGIYVEDVNLIKLAGAPGAREVRYPYIDAGRLSRERMERQLRAQAAQARPDHCHVAPLGRHVPLPVAGPATLPGPPPRHRRRR